MNKSINLCKSQVINIIYQRVNKGTNPRVKGKLNTKPTSALFARWHGSGARFCTLTRRTSNLQRDPREHLTHKFFFPQASDRSGFIVTDPDSYCVRRAESQTEQITEIIQFSGGLFHSLSNSLSSSSLFIIRFMVKVDFTVKVSLFLNSGQWNSIETARAKTFRSAVDYCDCYFAHI